MSDKWSIDDMVVGMTGETVFQINPIPDSKFRYRATHIDGRRAPKVILCNDSQIRPGIPCVVRVTHIRKPQRNDRGVIEVAFVSMLDFKLDGIYLDPMVIKKLQILLESGLNILLDGPQGCGKTVTARSIAETLGMKFVFFNCGAVIDASDFFATIQVRASDTGQPVTDFIKTEVLVALEEAIDSPNQRYLVFLDELNRSPESARNALMPALDSTRKVFHPIENRFIPIGDNVQFVAAVNRGSEFSATFGIDAAQLDRFAPLQMDYLPAEQETKLLLARHPELSQRLIERIVTMANRIRQSPEVTTGLSVRATEEACVYLKHPLMASEPNRFLPEVLKSSFCGRFSGGWNDVTSDAGAVWAIIERTTREFKKADAK